MVDQENNLSEITKLCLKVNSTRKRTVTYWGNNNQYDKEEMFVSSSLEIPIASEDEAKNKTEPLLNWLQFTLKLVLDNQEANLPKVSK